MELYSHQNDCLNAILKSWMENQFTLFVGPTGIGKTEILMGLSEFVLKHRPNVSILFLVNRRDLLMQTANRFEAVFPMKVGRWFSNEKVEREITISTVQSFSKSPLRPSLVYLDEAHNINQETGQYKNAIDLILERRPNARFVACTATPYRQGGGKIYGPKKWFKSMAFKKDLKWAIENGHLSDYTLSPGKNKFEVEKYKVSKRQGDYRARDLAEMAAQDDKVVRQVKDALGRLDGRKCVLWSTINIQHAKTIVSALKCYGESATDYHSKMQKEMLTQSMSDFKAGRVRHIVNVAMLNEGFDHPAIDAVVMMRPTRSTRLYVQTAGRGLRAYEGKDNCLLLDYGNIVANLGDLIDPVLPSEKNESYMRECDPCEEFFDSRKTRICPSDECGHQCIPREKMTCPHCKTEFPIVEKETSDPADRLSNEPYWPGKHNFTADALRIYKHIARSGNECLVYEFVNTGFKGRIFKKYFVVKSTWQMNRLKSFHRLVVKDEDYPSGGEVLFGEFKLSVSRVGKYWDVSAPSPLSS